MTQPNAPWPIPRRFWIAIGIMAVGFLVGIGACGARLVRASRVDVSAF